jgi:hypothetical protein
VLPEFSLQEYDQEEDAQATLDQVDSLAVEKDLEVDQAKGQQSRES